MGLGHATRAFSPRSQLLLLLLRGGASSQGGGVGRRQALCGAPGVVGPPPLSLASQLPLCVVASWCLEVGGRQTGRGQAGREERGCIQMPPLPRKGGETLGKEPAFLSLSF